MLRISNHTACRFAEKARFFRSLLAGRRCAAASRFTFEKGETLWSILSLKWVEIQGEGNPLCSRERGVPADCTKKVNKGIVKKESPMTVVLHTINLNNEKLSWGKTSYPNSQGIHRALAGENLHQKNCRTSWLQPGGHFKGNQTKFQ